MPRLLSKKLLTEARVATRPMPDSTVTAILRSLLLASGDAILVTDLDHRSLACNQKFGELFRVSAEEVVSMEPEALRKKVYPRLQNPDEWRRQLDLIYADPHGTFEDELELLGEPTLCMRRTAGPILDAESKPLARLWTFRDISSLRRRERMRDMLVELSTSGESDPGQVCKLVVQRLSKFYGSAAILSIREGDTMAFREVAGMPFPYSLAKSNNIKNSYCQVAIRTCKPLLIQDGRKHGELSHILPVRTGFTRYLGVPITDMRGKAIGTLCVMDGRSSTPMDDDDEQFLTMLGLRVTTELERERLYLERTADQRTALEMQRRDMAETHSVVRAMNHAFELAGERMDQMALAAQQVQLLRGLLGYESAAFLLPDGDGVLVGCLSGAKSPATVRIDIKAAPCVGSVLSSSTLTRPLQASFVQNADGELAKSMKCRFLALAAIPIGADKPALLAMGSSKETEFRDGRHQMLLEAIIDQVSLLFTAHALHRDLVATHEELKATQQRLVQSEKLSVVGTLAATIAHDIRNIVSALSLECSLGDTDPQAALLNVRTQLDRFAVLAHRLLSYSRPRLLAREAIDLEELIHGVVSLTNAQTRVAGVRLRAEKCPEPVFVMADEAQTQHLFVNLVLNAVQAMRSAGGTISIQTLLSGDTVEVIVADNGPGIPSAEIGKVFEPFYSSRPDGFGLGLYSCKRIAHEHGWILEVASVEGEGTSFTVKMPRCVGNA